MAKVFTLTPTETIVETTVISSSTQLVEIASDHEGKVHPKVPKEAENLVDVQQVIIDEYFARVGLANTAKTVASTEQVHETHVATHSMPVQAKDEEPHNVPTTNSATEVSSKGMQDQSTVHEAVADKGNGAIDKDVTGGDKAKGSGSSSSDDGLVVLVDLSEKLRKKRRGVSSIASFILAPCRSNRNK